jgi:DNA-directed RNA polymerase delta subunit
MSAPATSTALIELFLLVITVMLGVIGWGLRKFYKSLNDELKTAEQERERNREDIDTNGIMLFGSDHTPWDGFGPEIRENRRAVRQLSQGLDDHHELLIRHNSALVRENIIAPESPTEADPDSDDFGSEQVDIPEPLAEDGRR